jgi:hypothetical protein
MQNILLKKNGKPTSLEAYEMWRDHHQMETSKRNAPINNRPADMTCKPNGIGGLRCN